MKDWIKSAIETCKGNFDTDSFTFNYCLQELEKRRNELQPLIKECKEKGIDLNEISPELDKEYNNINEVLLENGK